MKRTAFRQGLSAHGHKTICDRCGFVYYVDEVVIEDRTGLLTCTWCYDCPHPADDPHYTNEEMFPIPEKIRNGDTTE